MSGPILFTERLILRRPQASDLDAWAARCRAWLADGEDVVVYFDNDAKGYAPHDAMALLARMREPGRT